MVDFDLEVRFDGSTEWVRQWGEVATPDNAAYFEMRGYVNLQQGKPDPAIEDYRRAAALSPGDTKAAYMVAQLLVQSGKTDEAAEAARAVLAGNPSHARAHVILGDYYRGKEEWGKALEHYSKAALDLETRTYAEYYIDVARSHVDNIVTPESTAPRKP